MHQHDKTIDLQGSVWWAVGGESLGGPARMNLLAQIAESGSITQAAKAVGMSYKGAWDAIDTMNNLAGEPLVERMAGGKGGGGTRLTERGRQLVHHYRVIEQAHQQFMAQISQHLSDAGGALGGELGGALGGDLSEDYRLIRSMGMKTSARNQYLGTVTAIQSGAVNDEVELTLGSGSKLVAIVTHESTHSLGLAVGVQAFALVKSSSIMVATDLNGAKVSARNALSGTIARVQAGVVNTEVVIDLGHGLSVAAVVTHDSAEQLALAEGQPATALFKASSVILGVPT